MIYEKIKIQAPGSEYRGELHTYLLDNSLEIDPDRIRPLVLICPGGGYGMTSDREAEAVAVRFLALGCHGAVLRYSVAPARYPEALLQLGMSVALLREKADRWHIDRNRIVVLGFSAGGHLAASLGVFWDRPLFLQRLGIKNERIRPDGMILGYPVITSGEFGHRGSFENLLGEDFRDEEKLSAQSLENFVTDRTPRTFLWHTDLDETVPVENSLLFYQALHRAGVSGELHIYPQGLHGLSLADRETCSRYWDSVQEECQSWVDLAAAWLKNL
ncbi:MAG: alpha/beta hydrolase [Eubacteriales bacterium]|nr:alpha/beta hydrolase [Eubacteriales bacterium]